MYYNMSDNRKDKNMKVININDVLGKKADALATDVANLNEKRKKEMLDILEHMREKIEAGEILEFTATSLDNDGDCQIHCYVGDVAVGIGLFEIGKNILINQYAPGQE